MAQVKYTKLKLEVNKNVNSFEFNGEKIEVLEYLPVAKKLSLVSSVVKQSMLGRVLRSDLLEIYLNLAIVDNYTNITFTEKQKEKNADLYDEFESSGLFDTIINLIPEKEYEELVDNINDYAKKISAMAEVMVSGYSSHVDGMKDAIQQIGMGNLAEELNLISKDGVEE